MTVATGQKRQLFIASLICGLASLFYVYDYFIQVAPSIMTHQLMQAFDIGAGRLGVLSACFYYSYTIMQIPAGVLIDSFGARKLLALAICISAAGVVLFGVSHYLISAGIARFLIGFGSAFSFISSLYLAARWFSHKRFSFIAGLVQLGASVGSIFGLAPLAWAVGHYGWRQSMITAGLLTFIFALVVWLIVRDSPRGRQQQPLLHHKQGYRQQRWLILLRNRQLWVVALCGVMCWVPVAVIGALWGVPYLMKVYTMTTMSAGKMVSLFWFALALGSPFIGWYSNYISRRRQLFIVCFLFAVVGAVLLLFAPSLPVWLIALALILLGLSASVQSLSFGLVKDIVPENLFATASGINNMAAIIGGGIAQPLVGYLLFLHWHGAMAQGVPDYSVSNYLFAFTILPITACIGLLLSCFFVKETYCQQLQLLSDAEPGPSSCPVPINT
ncbi:MAG: MFS transporter [Gammaproteobacteria bacterium]|nr:MFS transporter [Gammaproteobacteria bacterium]